MEKSGKMEEFEQIGEAFKGRIEVALKYDPVNEENLISFLEEHSYYLRRIINLEESFLKELKEEEIRSNMN